MLIDKQDGNWPQIPIFCLLSLWVFSLCFPPSWFWGTSPFGFSLFLSGIFCLPFSFGLVGFPFCSFTLCSCASCSSFGLVIRLLVSGFDITWSQLIVYYLTVVLKVETSNELELISGSPFNYAFCNDLVLLFALETYEYCWPWLVDSPLRSI